MSTKQQTAAATAPVIDAMTVDHDTYAQRLRSLGIDTSHIHAHQRPPPRTAPNAAIEAEITRRREEALQAREAHLASLPAIDARTAEPADIVSKLESMGVANIVTDAFRDPRHHAPPVTKPVHQKSPEELRQEAVGEAQATLLEKLEAWKAAGVPADARKLSPLEYECWMAARGLG